ncbi:MAG TPA: DHA2 family efflux MFS transporter permease subunit [Bacteroidota bacterium]|nr:DHA2 family efflux MFS transporter permease subunit [Bacteroidota bacterium]
MASVLSKGRQYIVNRFPQLHPSHESYRWLVLATVMIATFMAVLDATITNVALPNLMASFGVSVDTVEWILTAYLLIFSVMLPSSGWFADHWGYKRTFVLSLFLFVLGSFLSSFAWNFQILIVFRVIQGSGAGLLLPVGMAIITREFPPEKRGIALGFWSVSSSASVSLGPAIGGWLIDNYSWHTIFDVNVPIGIVGLAAAIIIVREHRSADSRAFDFIGFISLSAFLTALLLALSDGNSSWNTEGWTSTFILTNFAIAFVSLVVFFITEFSVKHPLIEMDLFKSFNFTVSNIVLFIFGLGMFGGNFLLPIYLQNSLGYTPLQAGLVFVPVGILLGVTSPFAGYFSDKYSAKIPPIIGLALLSLTFYQFSFLSFFSEKAQIMLPLYIRGVAMGLIFSPLTTIAISEIANRKMAQASGLINVIRQVGGSFGVAIFGAILTQRTIFHSTIYGSQLQPNSEAFVATITRLRYFAERVSGGTMTQAAEKARGLIGMFVGNEAFVQAVDDVFLLAGLTLVVSIIPLFFLRSRKHKGDGKLAAMD